MQHRPKGERNSTCAGEYISRKTCRPGGGAKRRRRRRMNEKWIYGILTALMILLMLCTASCKDSWWMGNDNGEAYEAYTEAMEEYGIPPNGYW